MKAARIAVLFVALGAAGGAALLARSIMPSDKEPVVEARPQITTTRVLVAARDIKLGARVTSADLTWRDWPADAVTAQYVTQASAPNGLSDTVGSIARSPMFGGEPVNANKLVKLGKGGLMSAILPQGMRAVSTRISPETGAGGFILPNDRVDVILTRRMKSDSVVGGDTFLTETILRNVRVLAIDQMVKEDDGRQVVVGKTATLELAPEQTEVLALADQLGDLSLALRSLADAGPDAGDGDRSYGNKSIRLVKFGVASQVMTSR